MLKKLNITILKKEFSYLMGSLVLFTSLFFLLFLLYIAKEVFIYYSNVDSILLPKAAIVVDQNFSNIYKKLKKYNISSNDVILAKVKNIPNLSVYSYINQQNTLPKNFTLISFDIHPNKKLQVSCQGNVQKVKLVDILLKQHKNWIFKTEKFQDCKRKEKVTLFTKNGNIEMQLKRNGRYGELLYKSNAETDKMFYHYLIGLEEELFLKYIPYSKYFTRNNQTYTKETKEHSKMLNSLFNIIFAKRKKRVMLNHIGYTFLTDYKRIPFSIEASFDGKNRDYTVVDELPIDIRNTKRKFYSRLIIANLSSVKDIKYDASLIFFKKSVPSSPLFDKETLIKKGDFLSVQKSSTDKINEVIYALTLLFFLLMLALINSFTTRNYALYKNHFSTLLFYGFRFKITTIVLFILFTLSIGFSYLFSYLLLFKINAIFNLYYVDTVDFNFEYRYLVIFFILSLVVAYILEYYNQKKLLNKVKEK